jgi:tRNA threonylcarbamoyl adenosine modification protein YeaZ
MVLGIYTATGVEVAIENTDRQAALASGGGALESLLQLIAETLKEFNQGLSRISLIGVCTGPGSFTGLRIGVSFAKSLAQARGLPIIGVSSYDVAEFGTHRYPIVSVARGKPGYYYARLTQQQHMTPSYIQGERKTIEEAAISAFGPNARIVGPDFHDKQAAGQAALAVAKLARQAHARGETGEWTNIAIDYGQRPNAVVNWERRHDERTGGPEVLPREPTAQ